MAESAVKIVKKIFKKAYQQNGNPYLSLLAHRLTPSSNDTKALVDKLFGRPLRTHLPDLGKLVARESKKETMFLQSISLNEWKKSKDFTIKVPDHYQRSLLAQRFAFERITMEKFQKIPMIVEDKRSESTYTDMTDSANRWWPAFITTRKCLCGHTISILFEDVHETTSPIRNWWILA